ncbi:hypothetical protein P7H02_11150 [Paenibacillus larvae]|nr:hypothetical protein [Paenibacillus larvae]MDT2197065.1 hypothetical protein [Paenibacillus larvae]MDT2206609.1 hypothetical protein [Paenibacillus larvae]
MKHKTGLWSGRLFACLALRFRFFLYKAFQPANFSFLPLICCLYLEFALFVAAEECFIIPRTEAYFPE